MYIYIYIYWTALIAVQSDLSSDFPYIYGYMTFPRAAQQVGARILIAVFCCFVYGFEGEFNLFSCCLFVSTTIY